jgi:hypothetical protein
MGMVTNTKTTTKQQPCIDACTSCVQACYECFQACLNEPDLVDRKNCVSSLVECAMMCQMSVAMMSMNGQFAYEHCGMCAKVCDSCAKECGMFSDNHCRMCADICRRCADECRKMTSI